VPPEERTPHDLTLGEVARQIRKVEDVLREDIRELSERLDRLDFLPVNLYAADKMALERRMEAIEVAHKDDHHRLRNIEYASQMLPEAINRALDTNKTFEQRVTVLEHWRIKTIGLALGVGIGSGAGTGVLTQMILG
jgi:hypothetical protein